MSVRPPDFPTSPLALLSNSTGSLEVRHTTHHKRRRLPRTEMHAGRQRIGNTGRLQVAEMVRLKIFIGRVRRSLLAAWSVFISLRSAPQQAGLFGLFLCVPLFALML